MPVYWNYVQFVGYLHNSTQALTLIWRVMRSYRTPVLIALEHI